ncbi:hypothetical protein F441_01097 [Phytophthora nicotianae CJ01A1]|uniref:DUF7769 domain-containing protein n=3 Tax=Phytophthora nicotianae TaxID=4792 RepID=W3A4F4_PHYNI|nr:hypothetical protein L915_01061 [Phytophthora nicotianae]ETP26076.1 hypothetical protein F441_01097 [Phytophthora nicotianae CJ01A1]ETP54100.1 hypothetical protein F442_01070 [Phytophthora nicotianae P10297]ETL49470.1 hypothetical protein L916_01043 [Phytophthora nicotianae]ETM02529.1 hypothetical protein L917_01015 [Phytophthora nicotianae]
MKRRRKRTDREQKAANIVDQSEMETPATETPALPMPTPLQATEMALVALPMPEIPVMAPTKLPEMPLEAPPKLEDVALEIPVETLAVESSAKSPIDKRKNLTDQQRVAIVHYLLANSAGGRLKHGDMKAAATYFGVHRATIRRLWKLHTASSTTDGLAGNVASRIKGHSGRKPKVPDEELKVRIAAVPAERRMTGRGLSTALGVSNSVVVRLIKSGKLRRHPKKLHYIM